MSEEHAPRSLDHDAPFQLGECHVDPMTGEVRRGEQVVRLQPQAVEVLLYLARRPGVVIPRNEIEDAVWADRTVGYDALTGTMFKLRKALGDDPRAPKVIETISKRGYRLLLSPEALATPVPPQCSTCRPPPIATATATSLIYRHVVVVATALMAVIILLASWLWVSERQVTTMRTTLEGQALVVLPFDDLGSSDSSGYLANGLTEDLTTALAKTPGLVVIARDSASIYKGQQVSLDDIAQRLDVDFVLRGNVRHQGDQVRINAQLVQVPNGQHIWAEQIDGRVSDVFDMQASILHGLVAALSGQPQTPARQKDLIVHTSSPQAYRAFQLGREHFYLYINRRENDRARELFKQALDYDPSFAMARAMLAWTHLYDATNGWAKSREASLSLAYEGAVKAIGQDAKLPLSYFITGLVHRERGDYVKAMVEAEKALAYDPNYANAHVLLATLLYYAGRPEESVERLKMAMRLNPHHPFNYSFHLGQAYFTLRRYDDAIAALQRGVSSNPASERLHIWLAASYAKAGKLDDAEWEAEQVRVLNPDFSLATIAESYPFKSEADRSHLVEALRKAGLN